MSTFEKLALIRLFSTTALNESCPDCLFFPLALNRVQNPSLDANIYIEALLLVDFFLLFKFHVKLR